MKYEASANYLSSQTIRSEQLKTTLTDTLTTVEHLLPMSGGHSIVLWDNEQQTFTLGAATVKQQPDGTVEQRVRREGGATRWIIDHREPLTVHTNQDPFGANTMLDEYRIQSYLGVPLIHDEVAIGVLYALSIDHYEFSPENIQKVQDFAHFVTITIANIQLTNKLYVTNQSLKQERNQLDAIFNTIPEMLYVKDTSGRFLQVNTWSLSYYNVASIEEIIGKSDYELLPSESAEVSEAEDMHIIATGEPIINKEQHIEYKNRPDDWLLQTKVPFNDADGNVVGIVGSTRIITEHKLAKQREQALQSRKLHIKMLQEFISSVAHDFRTPLSIINTQIYIMKKRYGDLFDNRLAILTEQSDRLVTLVDDMLMMVKVDALYELELTSQSLAPIIETAVEQLMPLAHDNHQTIEVVPMNPSPTANIATNELGLAFHHLIENALLHNPKTTEVKIITEVSVDSIIIHISDTGAGIAAEHLENIFDYSYRIDDARRSGTGGTGLGLSMVRKIIDLHHGSIHVISDLGQGTEFTIELPLFKSLNNTS